MWRLDYTLLCVNSFSLVKQAASLAVHVHAVLVDCMRNIISSFVY